MKASSLRFLFLAGSMACLGIAAACSGSESTPGGTPDVDSGADGSVTPPADAASDAITITPDGATGQAVTFSYKPSWKGVKSVDVVGSFGQASDWKSAFVTLTDDGTGTFTGKSPALANGTYTYLLHVTGDVASSMPTKLARYAIDPANAGFAPCPTAAPTFSADVMNPCSTLTLPQGSPATLVHLKGAVVSGGAPIAGYLVEVERNEASSHHMFADRTTTKADGTFDLAVAASGVYRLQVLHPSYYMMTDAQRTDPDTLAAVRRTLSSSITMTADRTLNDAEVSYDGYPAMAPRDAGTLPTTFQFSLLPGATKAHALVYGPGNEIGDPWWTSPLGTATSDEFDGGFNTKKADGGLSHSARYFWGTEQVYAAPDGGVGWTVESMVYPITWP